jgi:hypothetical protein
MITTTTTTTTGTALTAPTQQIITDAQTACSEITPPILSVACVSVIFESPSTMVLTGDLLIVNQEGGGYVDNRYIWQAVSVLRTVGYTMTSAELAGQGSQGNPHSWYIVMSK